MSTGKKKTSYTNFGHKSEPYKWKTLYTIVFMVTLALIASIEKVYVYFRL